MGQVQSWISVRNFDKYQHYKTRRPPWVKLYREILTDYELTSLPVSTRWLAVVLLLLASETDPRNVIPLDRAWLATRSSLTRAQVVDGIKRLSSKNVGFVRVSRRVRRKHLASTPLAECYGTSTEVERELDTPSISPPVESPHLAPTEIKCKECGEVFNNRSHQRAHYQEKHPEAA